MITSNFKKWLLAGLLVLLPEILLGQIINPGGGGSGNVTVGTSTIAGGTDTRVFFQDGASPTGVFQQSPYMVFNKNSGILTLQGGLSLNTQTAQILDYAGNNLLNGYNNNTFLGSGAGNMTTTGNFNLGIGLSSMSALTSGLYNIGIGFSALTAVQSSPENVGVGAGALRAVTTGTGGSIGIGSNAGSTVTTGIKNVCIGYHACDNVTTGANNVVIGGVNTLLAGITGAVVLGDGAGNIRADWGFTSAALWSFLADFKRQEQNQPRLAVARDQEHQLAERGQER